MSTAQFRVELPTHNYSFPVEIAATLSVNDLKAEINRVCPGQPRLEAQRIIWRGRVLADHEKVAEIRTDGDEPTTVHLNVRPNGWTSQPPNVNIAAPTAPAPPANPRTTSHVTFDVPSPSTRASTPSYAQAGPFFTRRAADQPMRSRPVSPAPSPGGTSRSTPIAHDAPRSLSSALGARAGSAGGLPPHPWRRPTSPYTAFTTAPVAEGASTPVSPSYQTSSTPEQPLLPSCHPLLSGPNHLAVTLTYIVSMHELALTALATGKLDFSILVTNDMRNAAVQRLAALGWSWPELLDTPFPAETTEPPSLKYEQVDINGAHYLQLTRAGAPTPIQAHALKVLETTFPLLFLPAVAPSHFQPLPTPTQAAGPPHGNPAQVLNERLRELGIPEVRAHEREYVFEIQIRPLLMPLFLLAIRAGIMLWLFAPSGKPIILIAVACWFMYETYNTIRNALVRLNPPRRRPGNQQPAAQPAQQPAQPQAQAAAPGQPPAQAARPAVENAGNAGAPGGVVRHQNVPVRENMDYSTMALDSMAQLNLADEEAALEGRTREPPPFGRRIYAFFALLLFTTYPAYWDRRRQHLRQREGRIRTELRAGQALDEPLPEGGTEEEAAVTRQTNEGRARIRGELTALHARRAPWVQSYVERVGRDEWVDE